MVTTAGDYRDKRYLAAVGDAYDGVVRVVYGDFYGTGTLLFDGRAVLTAAHLFGSPGGTASVVFETSTGTPRISTSRILLHPDYDLGANNDLALVWLSSPAPVSANRYTLYRDTDEIGQVFTMVGYGKTGTGSTGYSASHNSGYQDASTPLRLKANNQFDVEGAELKSQVGAAMGWSPQAGTQLLADFDNGLAWNDALGRLMGRSDLGQGLMEGLIAPGDSGGPAFLNGQLAGVASYGTDLSFGSTQPDIDGLLNSSFGELAAWQRVSAYQQWIDQSIRGQYPNAPTRPEEVVTHVKEGDSGTSFAYFLLQFTGIRTDATAVLSVDYATRDGTALAGSDYIAASGRLMLYAGETQAVIAVEIVGDTQAEPDEHFYLDVFNPVGGSFGHEVVKLTAMRTIVNDDAWFG